MRLIDADAIKDSLCFPCDRSQTGYTVDECRKNGCGMMSVIDNQPTIEPEVRHGRWIEHGGGVVVTCSNCNVTYRKDVLQSLSPYAEHLTRHCPNCGARMDGGADNGFD